MLFVRVLYCSRQLLKVNSPIVKSTTLLLVVASLFGKESMHSDIEMSSLQAMVQSACISKSFLPDLACASCIYTSIRECYHNELNQYNYSLLCSQSPGKDRMYTPHWHNCGSYISDQEYSYIYDLCYIVMRVTLACKHVYCTLHCNSS